MHRFFTAPENIKEETVEFVGPEVHHLGTVLRLGLGDHIEVLNGQGESYEVELIEIDKGRAVGKIITRMESFSESPVFIRMGLSLLKGSAMDDIIRKAVELGVGSINPITSRYCVRQISDNEVDKKLQRWQRIATEAAKQCQRNVIPSVSAIETLQSFCQKSGHDDVKLLFWEREKEQHLSDIKTLSPVKSIAFVIGPEGGFSDDEVSQAQDSGFIPISLGPRILRADTAPLAAMTLIQYRWGDLNG